VRTHSTRLKPGIALLKRTAAPDIQPT
jgi:hypothetical protein